MTLNANDRGRSWALPSCTLPAAELPLRVAEFGGLFTEAVRGIERVGPDRLRLELQATPQVAGRAAALVAAETECCSFFTFTLTATGGRLVLDVIVPPRHTRLLDGLASQAAAAADQAGAAGPAGVSLVSSAGEVIWAGRLRSGEVARAAGVNQQTLRYYERRGLLAEPDRTPGGHRLYPAETVTAVRVIKGAQRLGFSLDEIAELMTAGLCRAGTRRAGLSGDRPAGTRLRRSATAKLAEVETKIAELTVVADTLRAALDAGCADLIECARHPECPLPFQAG